MESLTGHGDYQCVLEIGPGTGMLSQYLLQQKNWQWKGMDIDPDSVAYMKKHYPQHAEKVSMDDFLKIDLADFFGNEKIAVIGNFPYNISSQILFKILENRQQVTEMVGMFQKEVAQRVVAGPGGKVNGILSILCQAYYDTEYLFQVNETAFYPPPKVKSAVIRLKRNHVDQLPCNEKTFFATVKMAYNQRRKTLRNALKAMQIDWSEPGVQPLASQRAEQLNVDDFAKLANAVTVL